MNPDLIIANTAFLGHTGYANHARNFFTALNKLHNVRVRNMAYDKDLSYVTEEQNQMIMHQQWDGPPYEAGSSFDISEYNDKKVLDIVLATTDHYYFYDKYANQKIAYNVWESTRQPQNFFNKIMEYDQLWVPSEWQKMVTVEQGYPIEKIKVVPEGIDPDIFKPLKVSPRKPRVFKFFLAGRWEPRKSTTEIIQTFLSTFSIDEPVQLIISADNPFPVDDLKSTEDRLRHHGFNDSRIVVKHFMPFEEYVSLLQTSNCFVSCSRAEGWNLPLIEAMACGTPTICSDYGSQLEFAKGISHLVRIKDHLPPIKVFGQEEGVPGTWAEPDFAHLGQRMRTIYENYKDCLVISRFASKGIRGKYTWENAAKIASEAIKELEYKEPKIEPTEENIDISYHFVDGPHIVINGESSYNYHMKFTDIDTGELVYENILPGDNWAAANRRWFTNWHLEVYRNTEKISEHKFDLKGKRVLISFESKSLGDTIAWMSPIDDFRAKHRCHVTISTHWNDLFQSVYPQFEFVNPGSMVSNLYALYRIGCWDDNLVKNKVDWRLTPIIKIATDILGMDHVEKHPRIAIPSAVEVGRKLVTISEHSTTGCKYWNYPDGWQLIVDFLKSKDYDVAVVSKEPTKLEGIIDRTNKSIQETVSSIHTSKFFMGVSSGPAWLAWALKKPVVLISGCSLEWNEFKTNLRIINKNVCYGCFNDTRIEFDRGDWEFCPNYKGTPRKFECTTTITPQMVIDKLLENHLL